MHFDSFGQEQSVLKQSCLAQAYIHKQFISNFMSGFFSSGADGTFHSGGGKMSFLGEPLLSVPAGCIAVSQIHLMPKCQFLHTRH